MRKKLRLQIISSSYLSLFGDDGTGVIPLTGVSAPSCNSSNFKLLEVTVDWKMPHDQSHGCGADCGHDHDIPESQGHRDNLFMRIDRNNVVALNVTDGEGPEVVKPWHERMNEDIVRTIGQPIH